MNLKDNVAIIYGAGGSLGGATAKAFAHAGAHVFLTGPHLKNLAPVAKEIIAAGGTAETAEVDALDEKAVNDHLKAVIAKAGKVDISFNASGTNVVQDIPLVEISLKDFMHPMEFALQSQFITATAAGRQMTKQGSGVILSLTATPGGIGYPYTAGFATCCAAMESLSRNLAGELGPYGVRAVNMRSGGSPDSRIFKEAIDQYPDLMAPLLQSMKNDTMLKEMPSMNDIAQLAVFLCSPLASKITGVTIDITAGTTAGLNYRATKKPVSSSNQHEKKAL